MKRFLTVLLTSFWCLPLPAQINVPKIGIARYPDGSFHSVQGLPANMIVADMPLDAAEAASFSDSGGLIAENGTIRLLSPSCSVLAEYAAGERPLLAITGDLTSALAWLPNAHTLLHWNGAAFDSVQLMESDIEGTVTDLQPSGSKLVRLIVRHADESVSGVTVSLRTGNLVSSEPLTGVRGYAFGQQFLIVYVSGKQLVADNLRGYRRTVAFPAADVLIERMSNNWLHLYSPSLRQNWALRITQSDLDLSMLPGLPEPHSIAINAGAGIK